DPFIIHYRSSHPHIPFTINAGSYPNWNHLADELKVQILQCCVCEKHDVEYLTYLRSRRSCFKKVKPRGYEIIDGLGSWRGLLQANHQIRSMVLDRGSETYSNGLCFVATSQKKFGTDIERLGQVYQTTEPNSVVKDSHSAKLTRLYEKYPKIYPDLKRFASLLRGIRCLYL
ncbi:hypothetical protein BCR34DRAFT_629741, partial [Clohesyomyces aquaticus]